jgi:hypothetical protein
MFWSLSASVRLRHIRPGEARIRTAAHELSTDLQAMAKHNTRAAMFMALGVIVQMVATYV